MNRQEQKTFHESEEQLSQRLREPPQQQIDDSKRKSAEYQDRLTSVSLEIERLKVQIADIDGLMQPYDAKMAAIRAQYPDLVFPSETFSEYERLLADWNGLNDQRNALITRVNDLVEQHNRTIEEFNRLTEQTNRLIDDLAWLP